MQALAAATVADTPRRRRVRIAVRVAVLSAALVTALSLVGGLGAALSIATHIVAKVTSSSTYAKHPKLVTLKLNAALDQYGGGGNNQGGNNNNQGGNNNNQGGGGGGVGRAPALTSASPGDGETLQSVSSIELISDEYVDWKNMRVTGPNGSVTTLDSRQGTSQRWSFGATAQGAYTISGTINGNNGSGDVQIASHFTIFVPPSGGGSQGSAPPAQATATPNQSGTVTSSDGAATIVWPAHTFGDTSVVVQVTPVPQAVTQNLPPNSLVVQVTAATLSGQNSVSALGGVLEIQFHNAPPNAAPLVSQDQTTWRAVPQLSAPQLPDGQADGYFRDSAGTVHVYTRHLTFFALSAQTAQSKLAVRVIAPARIWTAGRDFIVLHIDLTAPARITSSWVDRSGRPVLNAMQITHTLSAGTNLIRLHLPQLRPGTYRLVLRASGVGQLATTFARIRVSATQPPSVVRQAGPVGIVVVRGAQVPHLDQLGSLLGPKFSVTTTLGSQLFDAADPRATHTAAVLVDLDQVPVSLIASLHAVLPELQIIGLTSDATTAIAARKAGAAIVIAKPTSVSAVGQTLRALLRK